MANLNKNRMGNRELSNPIKALPFNNNITQEYHDVFNQMDTILNSTYKDYKEAERKLMPLYQTQGLKKPDWLSDNIINWTEGQFKSFNQVVYQWAINHQKSKRKALEEYMGTLVLMNIRLVQNNAINNMQHHLMNTQQVTSNDLINAHQLVNYNTKDDNSDFLVNDEDCKYPSSYNPPQLAIMLLKNELKHQSTGVSLTRDNVDYLDVQSKIINYAALYQPTPDDVQDIFENLFEESENSNDDDYDLPF